MSRRFTVEQRKKIKSLVLEGVCQHKTTGDIRQYIKENIDFEISIGRLSKTEGDIREKNDEE